MYYKMWNIKWRKVTIEVKLSSCKATQMAGKLNMYAIPSVSLNSKAALASPARQLKKFVKEIPDIISLEEWVVFFQYCLSVVIFLFTIEAKPIRK